MSDKIFAEKVVVRVSLKGSSEETTEQEVKQEESWPKQGYSGKARWEMFHDDDCGRTLVQGMCPSCGFPPDMQSTAFRAVCPKCYVALTRKEQCPMCRNFFEKKF